jgi:hypothetical protein
LNDLADIVLFDGIGLNDRKRFLAHNDSFSWC